MEIILYGIFSILVLLFTSITLLVSRDWRISLALLALQYIPVFFLVNQMWPLPMALVKVLAGWISCVLLGIAAANLPGRPIKVNLPFLKRKKTGHTLHPAEDIDQNSQSRSQLGNLFTIFAAGTMFLASIAIAGRISSSTADEYFYPVLGGVILIGMGLLQISFTNEPLYVSIGLLTTTAGFEIIYALIDTSVLVTGLLGAANLGIAMIGAYLLTAPQMDRQE